MKLTLNKQQELISEIISILKEKLNPKRVYLFGSRAAGTAKENSDFDIAVEGNNGRYRQMRKTKEKLDIALGIYSCDLVDLEKTGPKFKNFVREKGKIIYESD
jgi:CRISPR-associated protein Cmr1